MASLDNEQLSWEIILVGNYFENVGHQTPSVPLWLIRLSLSLLSIFKPAIAVYDQLPRLLCDKEHSIEEAQALIGYSPRTIEECLASSSDKDT